MDNLGFYMLKEKSIKKILLDILTIKWPLSINDLHKQLTKTRGIKVSYQAVRKATKQLEESGCLILRDKNKYQISLEWLKELSSTITQIEANYDGKISFPKTIFSEKGNTINMLIAKDGNVRDKLREEKLQHLLKQLIPIFREEFVSHNIFQKEDQFVIDYLMNVQKQNEIVFIIVDDQVLGGTVLEKKDESLQENHTVWKLKHFALSKNITPEFEEAIMKEIEERLQNKSKSMKIQLNLAENEERQIEFFERFGFSKEATLKNHYRVGESMFIYAKLYT